MSSVVSLTIDTSPRRVSLPLQTSDGRIIQVAINTQPRSVELRLSGQSGSKGADGPRGLQGAQGNQGAQGATGSQGPQGGSGSQGNQGLSGAGGTQGAQGQTGTQGPQGTQGRDGAQGSQGTTGSQGAHGADGSQGSQGTQGSQGQTGAQGNQGTTGVGTQGTQGQTGAQGSQGVQGTAGGSGGAGMQGPQGADGAQGTQGNQGVAGTSGAQGAQGAQGTQGVHGADGSQGSQGASGAQGATGAQGSQGNQGSTGAQGTVGAQGSQGNQGVAGSNGTQGVQGATGAQGSTGAQGAAGAQGSAGAQGTGGAQGSQGTQGNQGTAATSSLPTGIGPNLGLFDRLTSFYYPPGCENTLNQIGADIAVTQQATGGVRRWVWFGASEVRFTPPSSNVTSTTAPPMQLARALQRLGLPCADGMATLQDLTWFDTRWSSSACTLTKVDNGIGLFNNGAGSTATYKSLTPKTSIEFIWFDNGALNGTNIFTYNIDGAGAVNVVGGASAAVRRTAVTGLTSQIHTMVFTALSAGANTMCLFGANAYNANDLTVDNWGCSGSGAGNSGAGLPIWDNTASNKVYDMINVGIATAPTVAFVSLGANDYFNSGTSTTFKTALGNIINKLQTAGVQVVLVGIYPFTNPAMSPTDLPTAWRQVYYDLADTYSCPLVDLHDRWVDATKAFARGLLGNDTEVGSTYYIHPTPAGHSEIANAMTDLIGPTQPSLPVNIFNATSDPVVTDDSASGFSVGSRWVNTSTQWEFSALSVSPGAAVWRRISPTSLVPAVAPQAGASNILLPFTSVATAAVQTGTGVLNLGQFMPFIITKPTAISALAFNVTVIVSGGTAVAGRLALFNDNGAGGPGTLIADYGTTTFASTGIRSISGARTLQPGIYWGAYKYEYTVAPTTHPTLTSMNQVIPLAGPSMTSINYRCLQSTGTISGAFTSNPTATPNAAQAPVVGLVIA